MVVKRGRGPGGLSTVLSAVVRMDGQRHHCPLLLLQGPLLCPLPSALLQKDRACVINQSEAEFIPTQINGGLGKLCGTVFLELAVGGCGEFWRCPIWIHLELGVPRTSISKPHLLLLHERCRRTPKGLLVSVSSCPHKTPAPNVVFF